MSEEPAEYAAAREVFRSDAIRRVVFDMDGPTRTAADGTHACEGPLLSFFHGRGRDGTSGLVLNAGDETPLLLVHPEGHPASARADVLRTRYRLLGYRDLSASEDPFAVWKATVALAREQHDGPRARLDDRVVLLEYQLMETECYGAMASLPATGVLDLLATNARRGRGLSVATNNSELAAGPTLQHLGMRGYFDIVAGRPLGAAPEDIKPNPEIVVRAMGGPQVPKSVRAATAMVGDSPNDMRAAEAAGVGWRFGIAPPGSALEQRLRDSGAHFVVEGTRHLERPDATRQGTDTLALIARTHTQGLGRSTAGDSPNARPASDRARTERDHGRDRTELGKG